MVFENENSVKSTNHERKAHEYVRFQNEFMARPKTTISLNLYLDKMIQSN